MAPLPGPAAELVRAAEPDRYIATLYAPQDRRDDLFALYAFDLELRTLRERVSEPLPGEIRLQWWREALAAAQPTGSPLADVLIAAIGRHRLPLDVFDRYLEARIFDLYDDPMPDRVTLEAYCGETASSLMQVACLMLEPEAARMAVEASGHGGCAEALTRLVWSLAAHRRRGQCYVPREMLDAAGTDVGTFLSDHPGEGAARAAAMMIALARQHLSQFERGVRGLPEALRPVFLPVAMCGPRLDAAERAGAGLLVHEPAISPLRRHWTIWRRAARGWT